MANLVKKVSSFLALATSTRNLPSAYCRGEGAGTCKDTGALCNAAEISLVGRPTATTIQRRHWLQNLGRVSDWGRLRDSTRIGYGFRRLFYFGRRFAEQDTRVRSLYNWSTTTSDKKVPQWVSFEGVLIVGTAHFCNSI